MSIHNFFLPGNWVDNIDVNDFVNLNKKPFFKEPLFLSKSTDNTEKLQNFILNKVKNESDLVSLKFSFIKDLYLKANDNEFDIFTGFQNFNLMKNIGFSEDIADIKNIYPVETTNERLQSRKTNYQLFSDVSTSEIKKFLKIGVFSNVPSSFSPIFMHPDVRRIALYGTKRLIEDKRYHLKTLEKHLQTYDWIQQRVSIHKEIEMLKEFEKICKKHHIDISVPASSAKEVIHFTYLTILASILENSSVSFSLGLIVPFFDIFIEKDIENGTLNEEEAQELIEQFFLKLYLVRFVHSPELLKKEFSYPHFLGETIHTDVVTKTTYRFLTALKRFSFLNLPLRVVWNNESPQFLNQQCNELLLKGYPITFINSRSIKNKSNVSIYPYGLFSTPGDSNLFDAGFCDLEKVFYLSLNGGKDVNTNTNLLPITQPTNTGELDYIAVFLKFKEFLSYVISTYIETMNVVVYLNDTYHCHHLRSSLMSNIRFLTIQFGFSNIEKVIEILKAIESNQYEIELDKKGWIKKINPNIEQKKEYENLLSQIVFFIYSEFKKIPIHKSGKFQLRFYQNSSSEYIGLKDINFIQTLPPEYIDAHFRSNVFISDKISFTKIISKAFDNNISEINLSTSKEKMNLDSILYAPNWFK